MRYESDLHVAIRSKNVQLVKQILKNGCDVNAKFRGCTALSAAIHGGLIDLVKPLLDHGADVNVPSLDHNDRLEPPLITACRLHKLEIMNILLELSHKNGLDVDAQDFSGHNALWMAVKVGRLDMVDLLLMHGARVKNFAAWHQCPLYLSTCIGRNKRSEISKHLILAGCDLNIKDKFDRGAVYWTTQHLDIETLVLLINSGANLTSSDKEFISSKVIQKLKKIDEDNSSIAEYLEKCIFSPLNLETLCRNSFRKYFLKIRSPELFKHFVIEMNLPSVIQKFMLFEI